MVVILLLSVSSGIRANLLGTPFPMPDYLTPHHLLGQLVLPLLALVLLVFQSRATSQPIREVLFSKDSLRDCIQGLCIGFLLVVSSLVLSVLFTTYLFPRLGLTPPTQPILKALFHPQTTPATRIAIGLISVTCVPFSEEVMCRYCLFDALQQKRTSFLAVLLSSLFFAFLHLHYPVIPIVLLIGITLAILRLKTRSLAPCIIAHATFNALNLLLAS